MKARLYTSLPITSLRIIAFAKTASKTASLFFIFTLCVFSFASAQKASDSVAAKVPANATKVTQYPNGIFKMLPSAFGITPDVRNLPTSVENAAAKSAAYITKQMRKELRKQEMRDNGIPEEKIENDELNRQNAKIIKKILPGAGAGDGSFLDPLVNPSARNNAPQALSMPTPSLTFDGATQFDNAAQGIGGVLPPDVNGDVGLNHYVSSVNLVYKIFNKNGTVAAGPFKTSDLWLGLPAGDPCRINNDGDPVVVYDPLADRWHISQFAITGSTNCQCVAVSKTGDPTGAYYVWRYDYPNQLFNDYPKVGVWPDAYHMTFNQFNNAGNAFLGLGILSQDRPRAIAGDPAASVVYTNIATIDPGAGGALPADVDGLQPPPPGMAEVIAEYRADEFGDPLDAIRYYKWVPNFITPGSSTISVLPDVALAAFDARQPAGRGDIEQSGGANLDGLSDRLMHLFKYRNLGTQASPVNSFVGNFSVNVSGVNPTGAGTYQTGIRWFEMRRAGDAFSVFDQGTHNLTPGNGATGLNNWMGSIAQDNKGNLALGFSQSSTTQRADIKIAGRTNNVLNSGVLNEGEALFHAAGGSQTSSSNRWGDYSAMNVDPVDDCTFWYTQEYYASTSGAGWATRIGKFNFPSCTPAPKATIQGTITICSGGSPVNGALVQATGGFGRTTGATGTYSMIVSPGTYTISANKGVGFTAGSASPVTVVDGQTVTVNLCLNGVPALVATTATLVSENCLPANGIIDPGETVTVAFGVQNTGAASTTNDVGTLQATGNVTNPGPPQNYGVIAAGGPSVSRNFTFTADPAMVCGANIIATIAHVDGATNLGNLTYTLPTGSTGAAITASYTGPSVPIPDNNPAGANAVLAVSGVAGLIRDVNFRLDALAGCSNSVDNTNASITHTFNSDLVFKLTSPGGTTVTLFGSRGGQGNNFCTILLDDEGGFPATSTMSTAGAITGNFTPDNPLSAFDGQNANGNWTLNVADLFGDDVGTINRYSLIINGTVCCTPAAVVTKLYVNDDVLTGDHYTTAVGNDANPGTAAAPFATIAHAITVAAAGDTIYVDAGTFAGSTGPDKKLTFLGSNATISPNTGSRVAESILTDAQAFRISTTSKVIIKGFKLTTVAGNPIDNYTTGANFTLEKNLFDGSVGLFFANADSTDVIDNRFNNLDANSDEGILVAGNYNGTTGTYMDVHDNTWITGQASGMNLSNVKGIVYNNTFTSIAYYGILVANLCNLDIYQNVFSGITNPNLGSPTWGAGVRFFTPSPGMMTNVHNNYFSNNYVGVGVRNVGGDGSLAGTTVHVNNNSITGSTDAHIKNQAAETLDATCNWYGSSDPALITPKIVGPVTYVPFLTNGTDAAPATPGFQPVPNSCNGSTICESPETLAYTSNTQSGNQPYKGELGMEFIVNAPGGIMIKQLGAFDDGGNGITGLQPGGGVRVAIFNRNTHLLVPGLDVTISGTGDDYKGFHRMKNLASPINLPQGDYVIVAKGYHAGERNGNSFNGGALYPAGNSGGGAISFGNETSYGPDDPNGFNYPTSAITLTDTHVFLAGTFDFTTVVPCSPSTECESPAVQAYTSNTPNGNQAHRGELGLEFTVNNSSGIIVKQLGAFDDGANGISGLQPGGGVRVAIFNRATHTIVPGLDATVIGTSDPLIGNHRMKNITPVTLPPGDYVVVAKGYNAAERNGNSFEGGGPYPSGNTNGGAVTYSTESSYGPDDPNGFNYPASAITTGDAHLFLAGSFNFSTPLPCGPSCESGPTQAYSSNTTTGNQAHRGELGMQFIVNNPAGIKIKQLGAFDDGGLGITGLQPGGGVRVAIFNRATQTVVPGLDVIVIGNADQYTGNHRMKDIPPVTLPPGDYVIVAKGYHIGERNGNVGNGGGPYPTDNGGGAITFGNESSYGPDDPNGFTYPSTAGNFGSVHQFLAGTFKFTVEVACPTAPEIVSLLTPTAAKPELVKQQVTGTSPVLSVKTKDLKIYPDPTKGQFNVQLSNVSASKIVVQIINSNGKLVEQRTIGSASKNASLTIPFDLVSQPSGVYLVKVISDDGIRTEKLVIQR